MQKPYDNNDYYIKKFRELAIQLADTVEKKNKDYGASVGYHGTMGIMPRLADKFFRLDNLIWNQSGVFKINYESAYDTAMDLAAYAIIMAVGLEYQQQFERRDSC